MSFTYDFTTNPQVAYVRLLIPDTQEPSAFSDEEITAFYFIQQSQFQSLMFFSGTAGRNLPVSPVSYLRVAALALGVLAGNAAKASIITKLLDVSLDPAAASKNFRDQAAEYRKVDDEAGAIAIVEQCTTIWGFQQRFWNQYQRQSGGGVGGL